MRTGLAKLSQMKNLSMTNRGKNVQGRRI